MTDKLPWMAAHRFNYQELGGKGTTQQEIQQTSRLIPTNRSLHLLHQELQLLQTPFLLYSCRLLTKGKNAFFFCFLNQLSLRTKTLAGSAWGWEFGGVSWESVLCGRLLGVVLSDRPA